MGQPNTDKIITQKYNHISNVIITDVVIKNFNTGDEYKTKGIWDSGATNSVITKSIAAKLKLIPSGLAVSKGVHGNKTVNKYVVYILLGSNMKYLLTVTECDELIDSGSVDALIGMDIITKGDFIITNYDNKTVMSFRVPSLETVDYSTENS